MTDFIKQVVFLGGRPMELKGCAFIDCVSGKEVNYYIDSFGRKWLAESKWSFFRVPND